MTCWFSWPTLDGPAGILNDARPYRVLWDGRIVVPTRRERAAERARRGRTGRRAARGAPSVLATLGEVWR